MEVSTKPLKSQSKSAFFYFLENTKRRHLVVTQKTFHWKKLRKHMYINFVTARCAVLAFMYISMYICTRTKCICIGNSAGVGDLTRSFAAVWKFSLWYTKTVPPIAVWLPDRRMAVQVFIMPFGLKVCSLFSCANRFLSFSKSNFFHFVLIKKCDYKQ